MALMILISTMEVCLPAYYAVLNEIFRDIIVNVLLNILCMYVCSMATYNLKDKLVTIGVCLGARLTAKE